MNIARFGSSSLVASLAAAAMLHGAVLAQIAPGHLVINRVGDGTAALTNAAMAL